MPHFRGLYFHVSLAAHDYPLAAHDYPLAAHDFSLAAHDCPLAAHNWRFVLHYEPLRITLGPDLRAGFCNPVPESDGHDVEPQPKQACFPAAFLN